MTGHTAMDKEAAYGEIVMAAYKYDPLGWDSDDMEARADRIAAFLKTPRGQQMLARLKRMENGQ
jgi:hypothetical protein